MYTLPALTQLKPVAADEVVLVASGDLRLSANQSCWPAQAEMEAQLAEVFGREGIRVVRGHAYDPVEQHGFISSQRMGMDVFRTIHPEARVIVAESVWQYSHHVLAGLQHHHGPILTVANFSGQWPGLVGLLNLNGSLTRMGVPYSTIWSVNFDDEFFLKGLREWLATGRITHDASHVRDLAAGQLPAAERALGEALAAQLKQDKAILGVFDEGCMGMMNAILEDALINPMGVFKERLSQSALLAAMRRVSDAEAAAVRRWLDEHGMTFVTGHDEASELTDRQIHEQMKMYVAAVRMAHAFGCAAIGIQYQQGLKDMTSASDLVEGLLNNVERPPVLDLATGKELFAGQALPHFNEVDEGAALDALVTNRVWTAMGFDPETTLHDLRWGEYFAGDGVDDFVWVFLISGAAPAAHFGGYANASSERQPPMFFPLGGGTLKGVSKPGEIVWSRVFVMDDVLHADIGRGTAVKLPEAETERRWALTDSQWPIMHAVLHGVSRDQMMARHKANHIQVAYAPGAEAADRALAAKAAMFHAMGINVHICGSG
ncbi:MAG: fucose isomerase [Anaerolineae bacterium]|nr:fucose isomerase [Anaerolineae bacterium]